MRGLVGRGSVDGLAALDVHVDALDDFYYSSGDGDAVYDAEYRGCVPCMRVATQFADGAELGTCACPS